MAPLPPRGRAEALAAILAHDEQVSLRVLLGSPTVHLAVFYDPPDGATPPRFEPFTPTLLGARAWRGRGRGWRLSSLEVSDAQLAAAQAACAARGHGLVPEVLTGFADERAALVEAPDRAAFVATLRELDGAAIGLPEWGTP
jgi:hypothetical protein